MRKSSRTIIAMILVGILTFSSAAPAFSGIKEVKIKAGGSERLRYEYWMNISDYNNSQLDDRNFFRFRTQLWTQFDFDKLATFYVRMTNENRSYIYYGQEPSKPGKKNYGYDINEFVIDNLYGDLKNAGGLPIDLRVGRQDFTGTYGEGFLIWDGTPGDGSRTNYFNAVKASWRADDKNTLDLIYLYDTDYDKFLPVINSLKGSYLLNATDETAFILYQKSDSIERLHLEDYYIFKKEDAGGTKMSSKKTILNTAGIFAKYDLSPWTLRAQAAGQFGYYGDEKRRGFGGYAFIERNIAEIPWWSPQVSAGYVYLTGDDRKTAANEAWDPLFSRYPWLSDLYSMSYSTESGTSYWTNLKMLRTSFVLNPTSKMKLSAWYNHLLADDTVAATAKTFSGSGRTRGHLYQGRMDYAFSKDITTYILYEYLQPGNFYVDSNPAVFLRVELQIKF